MDEIIERKKEMGKDGERERGGGQTDNERERFLPSLQPPFGRLS